MKFMLLICDEEKAWAKLGEAERNQMYAEYGKFTADLRSNGHHLASSQLKPVSTAKSVRVRDGKRVVVDGPFAETREQLGGYYLIEAKDMDEALAIAAKVPSARIGTVEVRPLVEAAAPATA